ncbi:MAG: DUF4837 family protein [Bacteroidaceae bacterium]|nr:DUF4837 family protein [Bacteroidaceae bacterium]
MKQVILKVCMMLLAVMVTLACGNRAQKGNETQEGAQTETKTASKTGNAKKAKSAKKTAKKKKSVFTPTSAGAPYEVLLVAGEDDFHSGAVDSLYAILTDDLAGVAQSEPIFKVSRIRQDNLSKTLRLCRNIIIIKIDPAQYTTAKFKYSRDVYAAPQLVVTLQAHDATQFKHFVEDNRDMITEFFTRAELNRQIEILKEDHQPVIKEQVKKVFGAEIWAPVELTKVTTGRNFVWARCERFVKKVEQELNIVVYSYPYRDLNTFTEKYFIHKRDSVMKANIPGPKEGQYMMTTKGFTIVSDETVHKHYAQVVRGLWNIKDYDMGGPFVSVSRVDEKNQRVVVAEAFVYYPNHAKRDVLKKLEAALYTLRLPDELDLERFSYDLDEIIITPEN